MNIMIEMVKGYRPTKPRFEKRHHLSSTKEFSHSDGASLLTKKTFRKQYGIQLDKFA